MGEGTTSELHPAPPIPEVLLPLREKVAAWAGVPATEFTHGLVTEYRPGTALGWHRDVPNFELVVGEPRSVYQFRDDVRWRWQHSIPATKGLRHSITFRTLATR